MEDGGTFRAELLMRQGNLMIVLFCKSVNDVSKAQMLFANREQYRFMVRHRQKVCPSFAQVSLDETAIGLLPDEAVPEVLLQSAQATPEAANIYTTMRGPGSRFDMTHRQERWQRQGRAGFRG